MKKNYIAPNTKSYEVENSDILAISGDSAENVTTEAKEIFYSEGYDDDNEDLDEDLW